MHVKNKICGDSHENKFDHLQKKRGTHKIYMCSAVEFSITLDTTSDNGDVKNASFHFM